MDSIALFLLSAATASAFTSFKLPEVTSHQPNGNPDGQVNYYNMDFTIQSNNSGSATSGYCYTFWGDNSWVNEEAYSLYVPTDEWIQCDSSEDNMGDGNSPFHFKLFPYFSIGNFSIGIKEVISNKTSVYGLTDITNTTDSYTCTINPQQIEYVDHASGDCSIAEGKSPFEVSASSLGNSWREKNWRGKSWWA